MLELLLLADARHLTLDAWNIQKDTLLLTLSSQQTEAFCPHCAAPSSRIHSRHRRRPTDLSCLGYQVRLDLHLHRFFCDNLACSHITFVEQLPSFLAPYARRTVRLTHQQQQTAFLLGGELGKQVLSLLHIPTSADTLLRLIRRAPEREFATPSVLGVDDWALRRGQMYGTILVDLEQGYPVDLLPERSAEALAQWLQTHPGVETIARDRGLEYIKGATEAAPQATQVADRWHLLKNWREVVQRFLERKPACLRAASAAPVEAPAVSEEPAAEVFVSTASLSKSAQDKQARHARRQVRYETVLALHQQGFSNRAIARQLRIGRQTVAKYLTAEHCPLYPKGVIRPSKLDPYQHYLEARWQDGCHNASRLWREICAQGFRGSRGLVARWAAKARPLLSQPVEAMSAAPALPPPPPLTARRASWLFVRPVEELEVEEQQSLERILETDEQAKRTYKLGQAFTEMFRRRQPESLLPWLEAVTASGIGVLKSFADGLRQDLAAVQAALTLSWSSGPVEGQINRLKLLKRQMYGRAKFDLLRKRVLWQPEAGLA